MSSAKSSSPSSPNEAYSSSAITNGTTPAAATADIITAHRRVTIIRLTGTVFFQPSRACKYS
ncbi:MAG: hypothetical protein M3114_09170 [Thermoproteota archaeon]|nr:hypothetical protein [Thermoproteota archaeon]